IAPIFLSFMLFKFTKELFDGWLKQLLGNAMMVVVVSTTLALMANLILNQLYQLLYFKSCWDIVWSLEIAGIHFFDIWFWTPSDPDQLNKCLTPEHLFSFLLVCILFNTFMEEIPQLIDSLSGAFLQPISKAYNAVYKGTQNLSVYKFGSDAVNILRSPLSITSFSRNVINPMHNTLEAYENRFFEKISYNDKQKNNTEIASFARDRIAPAAEYVRDIIPDVFKPKKKNE
ncbi:MAG: type IV secretion system protein, partial [Candidatus Jidaibacter sp.]|nr:type IV secretion system protein [Candidatus Jidaibacter sp.]